MSQKIIFQIIFCIFSLGSILNVLKKRRGGELSANGSIFWVVFWLGALTTILWPNGATIIANIFGIGRGADFVLYLSVITLFFLLFKMHLKIERVNREVTKVVREIALRSSLNKK